MGSRTTFREIKSARDPEILRRMDRLGFAKAPERSDQFLVPNALAAIQPLFVGVPLTTFVWPE